MHIDLSPNEWKSFSREIAERDQMGECKGGECALPICCANISNLRDAILAIGENNGDVTEDLKTDLESAWHHLSNYSHGPDEPWVQHPTFQKFLSQAGLKWPVTDLA